MIIVSFDSDFDPCSQCWRNIWKYIAYPTNKSIHVVNFKITSKTQIFQYLKLFSFSMMSDVKRFLFNHKYHKICVSSFQTRLKSKPTPITDSTPICTIWKSIHEKNILYLQYSIKGWYSSFWLNDYFDICNLIMWIKLNLCGRW